MGMNDDLTPREHSEIRDLVLAGAQRIRPAHKHRAQFAAGAVALVLVALVTGGALATASLLGSDARPAPSPTVSQTETPPTPTPVPTPTTTAPPAPDAPSEGVAPFGGDCANTLTDEEVNALRGIGMARSDYRWHTGANLVLGGIDCVWVSAEAYLTATVHLFAYPADLISNSPLDLAVPGCYSDGGGSRVSCSQWRDVGGMWMLVRADGSPDEISQDGVDRLFDAAAARLADYPPGVVATRTAEWWAAPDCAQIAAAIDPTTYGYERVALLEGQPSPVRTDQAEAIVSLVEAAYWCELHFTAGSGDSSRGEVVRIDVVPGGGAAFPSAASAEYAVPVTVEGARGAVVVPGLDRYEGSGSVIVSTDGVNMLMVTPDWSRDTTEAVPVASAVFAMIHR
jgi:hypothetical protein